MWGSHFLSPFSKENSQGLSKSVSPFLLECPLQVLTACYRFSYYLTIFNIFPSSLLQIKWPSDFIYVQLGLELILTKSMWVEVTESSPVESLSLCHGLPLPGSLPLDPPSLKGTWRRHSTWDIIWPATLTPLSKDRYQVLELQRLHSYLYIEAAKPTSWEQSVRAEITSIFRSTHLSGNSNNPLSVI